ncbi:MAG: hypothetical protein AB7Y46_05185 [Armatimonadota bacterium]
MARRVAPVAQVELLGPGQRYQVKYDGFARADLVAELLAAGLARSNAVDWQGDPAVGPAAQHSAARVVARGELNAVIARPFLDLKQSLGLGHFAPIAGTWQALTGLGLPNEVKLYQADGRPNRMTGIESRFELPHNPVFCISLYRAEPAPEHDWSAWPPRTEIHFGIAGRENWALVLPYAGSMFLVYNGDEGWRRVSETERSVRVPTLEGFAAGQRLLLWVACLRERIVMSTDGFADDVWIYEQPGRGLRIPGGKLRLSHVGGQWMFSMFAAKMTTAVIDGPPIDFGYDSADSKGELLLQLQRLPVVDNEGTVLAEATAVDSTESRSDLTVTQRAWRATIPAYEYVQEQVGTDPETGQPVDFRTCVSPELYAVQHGQYAEVVDRGEQSAVDLAADVLALEVDHSERYQVSAGELALDNQLGQHCSLGEHRRVRVRLGWELSGEPTQMRPVLSGYLVEPPPAVAAGGRGELEVSVLDPLMRLRDEKADGRCPAFEGWPVVEVFHWVLDRCGLARAEQDLEDTGTVLSAGLPERPLWYPEPGRSWLEFLNEVARFDYHAGLFCDESGRFVKACRHCRTKRTAADVTQHDGGLTGACASTVAWELYTRGSAASDPEAPGEVLRLVRPRRSLSAAEFANYVMVAGLGEDGRPVAAVLCDPASLYDPDCDRYVGWRKMHVEALEAYTSQAEVNRLCQELFAELSTRPEHIEVVTPLLPQVRIGQVVAIRGGEGAGAADQAYRVSGVRHRIDRRRGDARAALTVITARWLGPMP